MAELISRDALLKEICNSCDGWCEKVDCDCVNCKSDHRCEAVCAIADAPTINADPVKHGRWVKDEEKDMKHCSECGYRVYFTHNYCPSCGAKMDLEG